MFRRIGRGVAHNWWLILVLLLVGGLWTAKLTTHTTPVRITSGSMRPALRVDDIVLVTPQGSYHKGDVIAVDARGEGTPEQITVHRLIDFNPDGTLVTKGDYNNSRDYWKDPMTRQRIIGKVVAQSPPHAGAWFNPKFRQFELRDPHFYMGVAGLALLLMALVILLWGGDGGRHTTRGQQEQQERETKAITAGPRA